MKVNSIIKMSQANGPGKRGVVWVQGCNRHCDGCFNQDAQPFNGNKELSSAGILNEFDLKTIEGITVSGGEPFEQADELKQLLKAAKQRNLNTMAYSGYTYKELYAAHKDVLEFCDYLVDGPYEKEKPSKCRWAGSGNQRFLKLKDGKIVKDLTECEEYSQTAEITIDKTGNLIITGFINE